MIRTVIGKLFKKPKKSEIKKHQVRIVLPEEMYTLLEWEEDGLPCIGALNSALRKFEHKEIFGWHLSLIIDFEDIVEKKYPRQFDYRMEQDLEWEQAEWYFKQL